MSTHAQRSEWAKRARATQLANKKHTYLTRQVAEESPEKIRVRAECYRSLSDKDLYTRKHIVIAGSGGDIRYLMRTGVPGAQIIACDTNLDALNFRYPGVIKYEGDIVSAVCWALATYGGSGIGSINVDLCYNLEKALPILRDVLDACEQWDYRGVVWCTFLRAHDPKTAKDRQGAIDRVVRESHAPMTQYQSRSKHSLGSPMAIIKCDLSQETHESHNCK